MGLPDLSSHDRNKLREVVHFVCRKMALEPHKLGALKLQRIIWYFDLRSYLFTGRTATGTTFVKGEFGPYTRDIEAAIKELVAAERLLVAIEDFHGNEARLIGKGPTDISVFSERERRWLDDITTAVCEDHAAASMIDRSHDAIWRMAKVGEQIPFAAAAVPLRGPSADAIAVISKELGLA